jgi:hypothetical protein
MRLNLLPTTVKKSAQSRGAVFVSIIIAAACIAGAVFLVIDSQKARTYAKDAAEAKQDAYDKTKALQAAAGERLALAAGLARNVSLYESMEKHDAEFPNLYNAIKPYVPDFFRLTHLSATPAGAGQTVVTMDGVIGSFQEYADLMLALLRIPQPYGRVISISRTGYQHTEPFVPPIDEEDRLGRPRKPGANPVPDDPLKRLEYYINQGSTTQQGYQGLSNFGSGQPGVRGARENESLIEVRLIIPYDLRTPDPRATLNQFGGGGAGGGAGAPGVPPGRGLPPPGGGGGAQRPQGD